MGSLPRRAHSPPFKGGVARSAGVVSKRARSHRLYPRGARSFFLLPYSE
jgi:hypothetical protein